LSQIEELEDLLAAMSAVHTDDLVSTLSGSRHCPLPDLYFPLSPAPTAA